MWPQGHQSRPPRSTRSSRRAAAFREAARTPARKALADIKLDGDLSPAETSRLDLLDIWDVLSAQYQSTAGDEGENDTTSTLRRFLTLNADISAVPSEPESAPDDEQQQEEAQQPVPFRKIGAGQCGAIFAPSGYLPPKSGGQQAFKFAKVATNVCSPAQTVTNLLNDYSHQHTIFEKFLWYLGDTKVPHTNNWNSAEGSPAPSTPVMGVTMPRPSNITLAEFITPETFVEPPYRRGLITAVEKEAGIHHPLPTDFIEMERIPPLPLAVRDALIDRFLIGSTQEAKQAAKNDPANADCLVRVYLGANKESPAATGSSTSMGQRRSTLGGGGSRFFSLRNFKLHLNQLSGLGLENDALQMAKEMAFALAVMHWAAKTDARDVEFVLGASREHPHRCPHDWAYSSRDGKTCSRCLSVPSSSSSSTPNPTSTPTDDNNASTSASKNEKETPEPNLKQGQPVRSTQLWLLDFNQCRPITFSQSGLLKMVEAVKLNDPYFPKPLRKSPFERAVWTIFVRAYLAASELILEEEIASRAGRPRADNPAEDSREGETILELPGRFIREVIALEWGRIAQREGTTSTVTSAFI